MLRWSGGIGQSSEGHWIITIYGSSEIIQPKIPYMYYMYLKTVSVILNDVQWLSHKFTDSIRTWPNFFAKDCTPCNRLCRMCSFYWSIFRRCISLNKNPTEICQQILQGVPCRGTGTLFVLMQFTRKVQNLAIKENANFTSSAAKSVYKKKKKKKKKKMTL